jgi:hypothetical protein
MRVGTATVAPIAETKVSDGTLPVIVVEPTPESVTVTTSASASVTLIHAFPEPSNAARPRMYEVTSVTSVAFTRETLPEPEIVTFTPPAESTFAAFPAASLSESFTSDP